jgi:hypothetical protein
MRWRTEYAEYLAEVRAQVCSHCPERAPDRPPFGPACRHCGVELQLNRIVESIHDAGDTVDECGPPPDRRTACARCTCLGGGMCPCPAGSLTGLVVRAVRAVDTRREQQDVLRRRLGRRLSRGRGPVVEMIRAYEAATGTCVCCD